VIRKARFYLEQERSVEVDLHAVHEADDGTDLMSEPPVCSTSPGGGSASTIRTTPSRKKTLD